MFLYVVFLLFNGNLSFYSNFIDKFGSQLMFLIYDFNKWVKVKIVIKEVIDFVEQNGYVLYVK